MSTSPSSCSVAALGVVAASFIATTSVADINGSWTALPNNPDYFFFEYEVTSLPDFDQVRFGLPSCGRNYCVPAASLNMLAYAANHGFPEVLPGPGSWQSDALAAQATAALHQIGTQFMNTHPANGTDRARWFFGLIGTGHTGSFCQPGFPPCEGLLPRDRFTVTAQFLSGEYKPRLYAAAKSAILNNGLLALCNGWYEAVLDCGTGARFVYRDGGHCQTVQRIEGHWEKGGPASRYSATVCLRDPGSDEGDESPTACDVDDPYGQSDFVSHCYTLGLERITLDPLCGGSFKLDRITYPNDPALRLIDAYLIVSPKGAYAFLDEVVLFVLPGGFGGSGTPPAVRTFAFPGAGQTQDVALAPDLESLLVVKGGQVLRYDPLLQEAAPLDPPLVSNPQRLAFGRHRGLYVIEAGGDLVCIDLDQAEPAEIGRVLPPNPCTDVVYDDASDEVVLLAPDDLTVYRYPAHLDAVPTTLPIPESVPMAGEMRMVLATTGELWLMSTASTELFRLSPDPDGALVAQGFALPAVQGPPDDLDVDDAGHLLVSAGGMIHELLVQDDALVPAPGGLLHGRPGGTRLCVTRSRTNYDPAVHATEEWRDVFPPSAGPGLVDCRGDTNGDGVVDVDDLVAVILGWNGNDDGPDVTDDGQVDVDDLVLVILSWGPCPELEIVLMSDDCAAATLVGLGSYAFDTTAATTDGPALPSACDEGFGLAFGNDIWLTYVPSANGTVTVRTCGTAGFDTRLAAYRGACEELFLVACNDDGPGCPQFTSTMHVDVTAGVPVRIRIGGYAGAQGAGTVELTQP